MKLFRSGFSLVEMLMVLMVVALISMSFFAYKQRGMEVDKAEDLGYRLYEYGQAVGEYLRAEGRNYVHKPDDPTQIVYQGYEWLQTLKNPEGKAYLNEDFSLVIEPLYIENIPGEKTPLMTEFSVFLDPATNTYHLQLEMITIGPVYSRNDFTTDEEGVRTSVQDVSLIARAVNYANEYRDTLKGSGVIQYERVELGAAEPPAQEPPGQEPPGQEPPGTNPPTFTAPSIIQGTLVDQTIWNDAWLLRSGQNTMQGPINFDTSEPSDSAIMNLDRINFNTAGFGSLNDLQVINFRTSGGTIQNASTINFVSGGGGINTVDQITMDPKGTGTITFPNASDGTPVIFKGLRPVGGKIVYGTQTEYVLDYKKNKISSTGNFCFITNVLAPSNGSTKCSVNPVSDGTGIWYQLVARIDSGGGECGVTCYGF